MRIDGLKLSIDSEEKLGLIMTEDENLLNLLVDMVLGLKPIVSGEILIDGRSYLECDIGHLRSRVLMLGE